jgi:hypothetical protein
MASRRHLRAIGSVAVSVLFSLSLPGLALAESGAQPNQTLPEISGVVKDSGGTAIAGIQVIVLGFDTVVTDVNGAYSVMVANSSYAVHFADPAFKYLHGAYSDGASGNFSVGYSAGTSVAVPNHVTLKVVTMPVGVHITGRLTGPAVPPNPLGGLDVLANGSSPSYSEQTTTAPDGTYSLTVPGSTSVTYTLGFGLNQSLYQDPCVNYAVVRSNMVGCSSVLVGDTDATGVNAQLALVEGDTLTLSPAETTVAAGTGQAFTATLGGGALVGLVPAGAVPAAPTSADVTTVAAFTITAAGGSAVPCAGATCTPSAAGDYTVTATYGITASAIVHVTAPAATPTPTAAPTTDPPTAPTAAPTTGPTAAPTAAPTAQVTLPPTSTGDSNGSGGGSPLVLLIAASAAAAMLLVGLRRPLRS